MGSVHVGKDIIRKMMLKNVPREWLMESKQSKLGKDFDLRSDLALSLGAITIATAAGNITWRWRIYISFQSNSIRKCIISDDLVILAPKHPSVCKNQNVLTPHSLVSRDFAYAIFFSIHAKFSPVSHTHKGNEREIQRSHSSLHRLI